MSFFRRPDYRSDTTNFINDLKKQNPEQAEIDCKYVGFECPDAFIVGYGLDYAERYRNLPYIGILKPEVYQGK